MKIVILDGFTANPGDLSWKPLEEIGEVTVYDRTPPSETVSRAADAEVIVTNKVIISKDVMQQLPKLKYVGVAATGYNVVDLKYASERNIVVTNIPAYSTASVAQMAVAHLLNATNRVALHADSVSKGEWQSSKDFCYWLTPQRELAGETFGIIGLGNTGLATARIVLALGMKVLAEGITKAKDIDDLLANSDVLSLHCPLTPDTEHIINKVNIAKMKRNAIIINTGRGPLVDEDAVAEALTKGHIEAFCADVLTQEPPRNGSPLTTAPRCFITPHIAWASGAARQRLVSTLIDNIKAFADGTPKNVVN